MKRYALILIGTLAALVGLVRLTAVPAVAAEGNPHKMTLPDGSADPDKCGVCHNDDLTLAHSKTATCTRCHSETPHSGAAEHLRVSPVAVARALAGKGTSSVSLPLTDEGGMYCGTCHLFHDPVVMGETPLAAPRPRSTSGLTE